MSAYAESVGINAVYDSFSQSSGDFTASKIVNLAGANYLFFRVQPSQSLTFPYGGYITWSFKPTNSSNALTTPTTGNVSNDSGSVSSSEIADNTAAIIEGQETIIETIREQIQYIIFQIQAFWNQLAGEFTNLFSKLNDHHQEDLDAWQENTSIIVDGMDSNTTNIINNNNQNTQTVISGWDGSNLQQSGNDLNSSLTQYDDIESGIHDNASGWLSGYTLPDFDQLLAVPGVIAACTWLGTFMQSVFVNMGAFNIPVTLSLVLIFVLILVGYYRIRR